VYKSSIRVLVVDDYEPWRLYFSTTLGKEQRLQVIGEASDGLEAVLQAQELQPDLILLDIGLPTLNGIEAARRVREVSPESKILFVSQESSADVVREALGTFPRKLKLINFAHGETHKGNERTKGELL